MIERTIPLLRGSKDPKESCLLCRFWESDFANEFMSAKCRRHAPPHQEETKGSYWCGDYERAEITIEWR